MAGTETIFKNIYLCIFPNLTTKDFKQSYSSQFQTAASQMVYIFYLYVYIKIQISLFIFRHMALYNSFPLGKLFIMRLTNQPSQCLVHNNCHQFVTERKLLFVKHWAGTLPNLLHVLTSQKLMFICNLCHNTSALD